MNREVKDVSKRAVKTFWQSSIAYLLATIGTRLAGVDVFDLHALKNVLIGLFIGSLAAGISASWNGAIQPALDKLKGGGV